MRSHTELIINSRFIVHPNPLISFFKAAFPHTSSLAQIYFGLFLSLNQHPFILQAGSSSLRSRMGDFASTSCSSLCCFCGVLSSARTKRVTPNSRVLGTYIHPFFPQCGGSPTHKNSKERSRR